MARPKRHVVAITPADGATVGTSGASEVVFDNTTKTITTTTVDFVAAGVLAGDTIIVTGSTANNGSYLVASVAQYVLTLDAGETLTDANPDVATVTFEVSGPTHRNLPWQTEEIFVTAAGNINMTVIDSDGSLIDVVFPVQANTFYDLAPIQILATSTTATGLYSIY